MLKDQKKGFIILLIIYIICILIVLIYSYFDFKQDVNEENYNKQIRRLKDFIILAFIPGINFLYTCMIIGCELSLCLDKLLDFITKNTGKKIISAQKELKILKSALIESKYFKDDEEIQLFINGKLIINKLEE